MLWVSVFFSRAKADIERYEEETRASEARYFDAQKAINKNADKLEQIAAKKLRIEESLTQIDQEQRHADSVFEESRGKLEKTEAEINALYPGTFGG